MKKAFRQLLALIIIAALLCGCAPQASRNLPSDNSGDVPVAFETDPPGTEPASAADSAVLGNTGFKTDGSESASVDYKADGTEATVKLTDKAGYTWELTIPGDALLLPCRITLTPLSDITGNDVIGKPASGILLEPDGMIFIKPAKLTVSGPDSQNGLVISGAHDGSQLDFSACRKDGRNMSADICHFSSVMFISNDKVIDELHKKALSVYKDAVDAADKLCRQPLMLPPAEPVEISCKDTDAIKKQRQEYLDTYAEAVMQPESDIIERILSAHLNVVLSEDADEPIDQMLLNRLFNRLSRKINELYKKYYPAKEYILPVFYAAATIYNRAGMLNMSWNSDDLFNQFSPWFEKACSGYLDKIKTEHDFTVIPMYIYLARGAAISGGSNADYLTRLEKALTFKVEFEEKLITEKETFELSGVIPGISKSFSSQYIFTISKGSGDYTGFELPDGVSLVLPDTFELSSTISEFLPCENSLTILVDRFGAEKEGFSANGHTMGTGPVVDSAAKWAFADYMVSNDELASLPPPGPWYAFEMPLQNKNELVANKTFSQSMTKGMVTYTLKVYHTPG